MNLWWNYPMSKAICFMEHTRWRLFGCVLRIGPIAFCLVWRKAAGRELAERLIAAEAKAREQAAEIERINRVLGRTDEFGGDWVDALERMEADNERLRATVDAIDFLRATPMSGVDIFYDNLDGSMIEVWGDWVASNLGIRKQRQRFYGKDLADCLRQAVEVKRAAEAATERS